MRPPKVAFLVPREESRTRNDAVSRVSGSLVSRLTSRGARKATFGGHVITARAPIQENILHQTPFHSAILASSCTGKTREGLFRILAIPVFPAILPPATLNHVFPSPSGSVWKSMSPSGGTGRRARLRA